MSTENAVSDIEAVPANGVKDDQIEAIEGKTGEPEQKTGVAPQDAEAKTDDQSKEPEAEPKKLTPEQKTIRDLQRRVERLNGKVGGASRERDLLLQQVEQLSAKLSERPAEQEEGEDKPQAHKPNDIDALVDQRAAEKVYAQTLNAKADALLTAGKKVSGFDAALQTLRSEIPFADRQGRPTAFLEALLETGKSAVDLVMYLDNEPDEAAELAGLNPVQLGRRLGMLEAKLTESGKVKTSKAPAPIEPITAAGAKQAVNLNFANQADYEAQRAKQGAAWARRR
jgi:hypothetical protein